MARLHCLVPGCRRTLAPEYPNDTAGICQKHWQTIPLDRRKVYRRLRGRQRELRASLPDRSLEYLRLTLAIRRVWLWLERHAVERSVGI